MYNVHVHLCCISTLHTVTKEQYTPYSCYDTVGQFQLYEVGKQNTCNRAKHMLKIRYFCVGTSVSFGRIISAENLLRSNSHTPTQKVVKSECMDSGVQTRLVFLYLSNFFSPPSPHLFSAHPPPSVNFAPSCAGLETRQLYLLEFLAVSDHSFGRISRVGSLWSENNCATEPHWKNIRV